MEMSNIYSLLNARAERQQVLRKPRLATYLWVLESTTLYVLFKLRKLSLQKLLNMKLGKENLDQCKVSCALYYNLINGKRWNFQKTYTYQVAQLSSTFLVFPQGLLVLFFPPRNKVINWNSNQHLTVEFETCWNFKVFILVNCWLLGRQQNVASSLFYKATHCSNQNK